MDAHGLADHPDLNDEKWIREATRRAEKEARAARRRERPRLRLRKPGRRGRTVGAVVVVAALLAGGAVVGGFGRDTSQPSPLSGVDLGRPFAGTHAEGWADGGAGVVAPQAQPVGTFTAEQVAQAYEQVRQAVIASRLDRRVVEQHDVEPFVGLLAPDLQDHVRGVFDGRKDAEASLVVTRLLQGWPLLPVEPKVTGSMRAEAGGRGELVVRTNYLIAYAFATPEPGRLTGPMDIIAVNRVEMSYVVRSGEEFRDGSQGLWTDEASGHGYSISCEAAERGFLAPWIADRRTNGADAAEEPEHYFDPNRPMPTGDSCHA